MALVRIHLLRLDQIRSMGKSLNYTLPKTAFVNKKEQKMKPKLNQNKLKLAI